MKRTPLLAGPLAIVTIALTVMTLASFSVHYAHSTLDRKEKPQATSQKISKPINQMSEREFNTLLNKLSSDDPSFLAPLLDPTWKRGEIS